MLKSLRNSFAHATRKRRPEANNLSVMLVTQITRAKEAKKKKMEKKKKRQKKGRNSCRSRGM